MSILTSKQSAFKALSSFEERIEFWDTNIPMPYIEFLQKFNETPEYQPFDVIDRWGDDRSDWHKINQWIIDNYVPLSDDPALQFLNLADLKINLDGKLAKADNKLEVLYKELKEIESSFRRVGLPGTSNFTVMMNFKFNCDFDAYNDFLNYQILPDYSSIRPGLHIIKKENGKIFAEYKNHLASLIKKLNIGKTEKASEIAENVLTNRQVALLFHYSGILDNIKLDDTTKKANLFSALLNRSYKSLYDNFRTVNQDKRKEDLEKVLNFMEENKLQSITKKLKLDLKKVSEK